MTLPYPWVDVNNRRAFRRATDFLLDLGHRRIALVNGLEFMDFAMRRRGGYLGALTARGLPSDPALMDNNEMTEVSGYRAAKRMLASKHRRPPSASSMISGMGIRRALEEHGLKLGRDISIIIHDDDLSYMKNDVPIFTATRSSVREAGRIAADMLLGLIAHPQEGAADPHQRGRSGDRPVRRPCPPGRLGPAFTVRSTIAACPCPVSRLRFRHRHLGLSD